MPDDSTISEDELAQLLSEMQKRETPTPGPTLPRNQDARAQRWVVSDIYATLYVRGEEVFVPVHDVSATGLRILNAPESLTLGSRVLLVAPFYAHGTLAVPAAVIHLIDTRSTRAAGLKFEPIHPDDLNPIRSLLRTLQQLHTSSG